MKFHQCVLINAVGICCYVKNDLVVSRGLRQLDYNRKQDSMYSLLVQQMKLLVVRSPGTPLGMIRKRQLLKKLYRQKSIKAKCLKNI